MNTTIPLSELQRRLTEHKHCRSTTTNLGVICSDHNVPVMLDTEFLEGGLHSGETTVVETVGVFVQIAYTVQVPVGSETDKVAIARAFLEDEYDYADEEGAEEFATRITIEGPGS